MTRIYYLIVLLIGCALASEAQYTRYTVQLKDKQGSAFSISRPAEFLSARSIQRRNKQHILIDSTDLPVSKIYTDSIAKISGVKIIYTSKWLNNVLVEVPDSAAIDKIGSYPFVKKLIPVAIKSGSGHFNPINKNGIGERPVTPAVRVPFRPGYFSNNSMLNDSAVYGQNYPQVHIHEGEYLHKLGFRGQDIIIAILDAGFSNFQGNAAFDSLRSNNQILGEYDFVHGEVDVNNDDSHGANCLSIIAANLPGQIVGTAPKASFYLFKSEDVTSEKPIEEEYWAVAAERADSAGADIISSSLGYSNFDDPSLNLTYALRDGKTAPITIAANMAFTKGMIVTNSSGNSGGLSDDFKYVICPADGDNVLAIGAVGTDGVIAGFSSGGPNGAGKRKPDVVSVGFNTVFVYSNGFIYEGSGTSYSNPNMAGLIACLWQAFSEFSNAEIIEAVEKSADRYDIPDNRYGYGIPNMRIAYQLLDTKRKARLNEILTHSYITAYPVPFKQSFTVFIKAPASGPARLKLVDVNGIILEYHTLSLEKDNYYSYTLSPKTSSSGIYFLQFDDGKNKTILKLARL